MTRRPPAVGQAVPARRVWALTFEHSPVGMALVLPDGTWSRVNRSLCRMLGYGPEELRAMTFQDITHPDDLDEDLGLVQDCLQGHREGYRLTKRYLHRDGRLVWGDLSVALVRDDAGAPVHFVSQVLDVTQQRADRARLEAALLEATAANHDLARFAGVVSHDLKVPLTTARAALEVLSETLSAEPVDRRRARVLARQAEGAAQRMAALVDALLAHETTAADDRDALRRRGALSSVRLDRVLADAVADLDAVLRGSGTTVVVDGTVPAQPRLRCSGDQLRTVLVNVLGNAVKYRDPGRDLTVRVSAGPDPDDAAMQLVRIANDGPEIAEADRERVFGFLARGADEDRGVWTAPRVSGFGIGLASCRRIVNWHGGRIWIDQPASGGVEVCFTLPVRGPHHPVSPWLATARPDLAPR